MRVFLQATSVIDPVTVCGRFVSRYNDLCLAMSSLNSFWSACTKQTPCQNKHTLENRTVYCKSTFWVHVLRPKIRWRRFSWAQGHVERNSISANIRIPCGTRPRDLRFAKLCLFFARVRLRMVVMSISFDKILIADYIIDYEMLPNPWTILCLRLTNPLLSLSPNEVQASPKSPASSIVENSHQKQLDQLVRVTQQKTAVKRKWTKSCQKAPKNNN